MESREIVHWQEIPQLGKLLELTKKPEKLFYRGQWNPTIFENCVAVVGSRRVTQYGRWVVERLVRELVRGGKTIVSGFMYGVDQCAHTAAVEAGGRTIAVLGWGIDWKLKEGEEVLAKRMTEGGGLLISEWKVQMPGIWTFPIRNRIVAALSEAVYVVEAAEKSGSLITVNEALKLGRKIYAVPGPLTSRVSQGTNGLIAAGKATAWLPGVDLKTNCPKDSAVLKLVREQGGLTADEMARILSKNVAEIGGELTQLSLSGVIADKDGKYFEP